MYFQAIAYVWYSMQIAKQEVAILSLLVTQ